MSSEASTSVAVSVVPELPVVDAGATNSDGIDYSELPTIYDILKLIDSVDFDYVEDEDVLLGELAECGSGRPGPASEHVPSDKEEAVCAGCRDSTIDSTTYATVLSTEEQQRWDEERPCSDGEFRRRALCYGCQLATAEQAYREICEEQPPPSEESDEQAVLQLRGRLLTVVEWVLGGLSSL